MFFKKAKKLIDLAVQGGAHAAKFQTYKLKNWHQRIAAYGTQKKKTLSQYKLF